ncbi:MAG TPA: purine-nucleoside phosphorylase [Candidatus Riflebacteria bacterium]|jgi:purine-nucleoside phosphorylase|nr:purine-nucleoside phosphorylase [Candidatus Riflebacteria bacterium]
MEMKAKIKEAADFINQKATVKPTVALVLGSGLGKFADTLKNSVAIPYEDIPHFPVSTVKGHASRLVIGEAGGKQVVAMQGRFHYYEGYSMQEITFPMRVMMAIGAVDLIITNASGGLNRNFKVGDLMIMTDHMNHMGDNPLRGINDDQVGPRFPPMQGVYTPELVNEAMKIGRHIGAPVERGVYVAVSGPNYETAAELRAFRTLGADAVGMSTVPEVIVAVHGGIKRILGISCITDMATGEGHEEVNHEDVIAAAAAAQPYFLKLIEKMLERL